MNIDFEPIKDCQNIEETYGYICVKCNRCGRFNVPCCLCGKSISPEDEYITVEFNDVFSDVLCKEHEHLIVDKTDKYEEKYLIHESKKTWINKQKLR